MEPRVRRAVFLFLLIQQTFPFMFSLTRRHLLPTTRRKMSFSSVEDVAHRLVNTTLESSKPLVCIAVAGGGSSAISALASTPGASSILLEGIVTYDRSSFHNYVKKQLETIDVPYVSSEAAHLLSQTALRRALRYRCSLSQQASCVGVGASSALVQAKPNRTSRGYVVATHANGKTWECFIQFAPHHRSRAQQDKLLGGLVLQAIEQVCKSDSSPVNLDLNEKDEFQQWHSPGVPLEDSVKVGAERVLLGETSAVLLLPAGGSFVALPHVVLPNQCLVFPGSFNPPHVGHISLANAATSAYLPNKNNNKDAAVLFELSLINADKPSMDAATVSERAHKIFELENLPSNWGVLLTSVPLFSEKANVLRDCIVTDFDSERQLAFVIGTDTMLRILNPKYYGDSMEAMLEAIRDMKRHGVHFVVGGRLQQGVESSESEFVTGENELKGLPADVQEMFALVKETDFRVDLSSTELRKQAEEGKLTSPP